MQTLCEQPTRLPPVFDSPSLLLVRAPQPSAPYTWCPWRFAALDVKQTVRRTLDERRESVISECQVPSAYRTRIRINGRADECPLEYPNKRKHKPTDNLYKRRLC